ncbi:MAG TPA: VOC family protein [Solirubrobacteraceae bacterium]|nr:VOC family protein [Solirubrobacteraceae bacterium]
MPERDGYIPGVPCWVDASQPDPEAAVAFYSGLFGWKFENVMPAGSEGAYFIARIRGGDVAAVTAPPQESPHAAMWNTYISVARADDAAARALEAGGEVLVPPFDVMEAGRTAVLADPEGAIFCVWEARRHRGAQIVNEHGAVNFNGLHTRDLEAAKRFYGSVFGWETLTLDGGNQMWTLPGYGDELEREAPGRRAQTLAFGVPAEFMDVVANISPIPAEERDVPPHWDVTFGVDDADGIAERATELGATVLAGPVDVPWARMTMISDPQGATFIANQFVPENRDIATRSDVPVNAA